MALALVLWVLVIGAALLTAAVFLGFQEQRASGAGRRQHRALSRAESGLAEALAGWTPGLLSRRLPQPFDSLVISGAQQDGGWRGAIHRLNQGLFLVEVTASDPIGENVPPSVATQARLGWLVRSRPLDIVVSAALSVGGSVTLGDGTTISGRDEPPASWSDCPPSDSGVAGVVAESLTITGSARIDGSPPAEISQRVDSSQQAQDRLSFDQLATQATISLPGGSWATGPVITGNRCDAESPLNWGDPSDPRRPCGSYLPIVRVTGDLTLLAGEGQGILLVDGNLAIPGSYSFSGLIFTRGTLDVSQIGSEVGLRGAVSASSVGSATRPVAGLALQYSKCMIYRALETSGRLSTLASRSWKQLF